MFVFLQVFGLNLGFQCKHNQLTRLCFPFWVLIWQVGEFIQNSEKILSRALQIPFHCFIDVPVLCLEFVAHPFQICRDRESDSVVRVQKRMAQRHTVQSVFIRCSSARLIPLVGTFRWCAFAQCRHWPVVCNTNQPCDWNGGRRRWELSVRIKVLEPSCQCFCNSFVLSAQQRFHFDVPEHGGADSAGFAFLSIIPHLTVGGRCVNTDHQLSAVLVT
jgi:hypothetical protein